MSAQRTPGSRIDPPGNASRLVAHPTHVGANIVPPFAVCPDCRQDVRNEHCADSPDITVTEGVSEESATCDVCGADSTHMVRMRWHCRARMKLRGRDTPADPLASMDYWRWLNYAACGQCAMHAVDVGAQAIADGERLYAIGWDWSDAMDSAPNPSTALGG